MAWQHGLATHFRQADSHPHLHSSRVAARPASPRSRRLPRMVYMGPLAAACPARSIGRFTGCTLQQARPPGRSAAGMNSTGV